MEQIVGGDRVLHHAEICRTFEQMLSLATSVLRANLLAINTLNGQALFRTVSLYVPMYMAVDFLRCTYLVFFLCTELNESGVHIV